MTATPRRGSLRARSCVGGARNNESPAMIIATGASRQVARFAVGAALLGHGVSTCATCDGFFFRGKRSRSSAAATPRSKKRRFSRVRRQGHARASARRASRVEDHAGQGVRRTRRSTSMEQHGSRCHRRRQRRTWCCATSRPAAEDGRVEGVFVAIGHTPNTAPFQGQLETDERAT